MLNSSFTVQELILEVIQLEGSTTSLIESVKGKQLLVELVSQSEVIVDQRSVIERISLLHTGDSRLPLLYCVSNLYPDMISEEEYFQVTEKKVPIGKTFASLNRNVVIKKLNTEITLSVNPSLSNALNVDDSIVYRKKYDYWVGDRKIGDIAEMFNAESLFR